MISLATSAFVSAQMSISEDVSHTLLTSAAAVILLPTSTKEASFRSSFSKMEGDRVSRTNCKIVDDSIEDTKFFGSLFNKSNRIKIL